MPNAIPVLHIGHAAPEHVDLVRQLNSLLQKIQTLLAEHEKAITALQNTAPPSAG